MSEFRRVLVTDASERSSLAIIRSLGSKGIEVTACDSMKFSMGFMSRYVKRSIAYPPPNNDIDKFVKYMKCVLKNGNYDLVIPVGEFTTLIFSKNKEEFEKFVNIAIEDYKRFVITYDKSKTFELAKKIGVPSPNTIKMYSPDDIRTISSSLIYPVVIKPRSKSVIFGNRIKTFKIDSSNIAFNRGELLEKYPRISKVFPKNYLPIIQEYINGDGYGAEFLFNKKRALSTFVHKRLRTYPVSGGASTLRISTKNHELIKTGRKILKNIGWLGVAMLEFKKNEGSGKFSLIEINGRFWGSLPLAVSSGVDFPYHLYCLYSGNRIEKNPVYKTGIKQRWLIPGDTMWLLSSVKNGNGLAAMKEFLKSAFVRDDIISAKDPAPAIGAIISSLNYASDVIMKKRSMSGEYL